MPAAHRRQTGNYRCNYWRWRNGSGCGQRPSTTHTGTLLQSLIHHQRLANGCRIDTQNIATHCDAEAVFTDPTIDAVALTTLADIRPRFIRRALETGKHIWAEKPLAATADEEEIILSEIEASDRHCAVNMFNRNARYHECPCVYRGRSHRRDRRNPGTPSNTWPPSW